MHRLTVFQHDIVGDVYEVVNRTHTACTQPFPHPARRWSNLYILDNPSCIAWALFLVLDFHLQCVLNVAVNALEGRLFQVQRNVIGCSSFSCQTGNRQAVRTVGSDFKFYRCIIQTDGFVNILSNLTIFLNEENAVCNGIREIMNRQAQFAERAEHAVAFHATQLTLFDFHTVRQFCTAEGNRNDVASLDVWCTGYNLNRLFLSNIDLTNDQMVRVFVRNNRKQLSDDNIFNFAALFGGNFYL